MPKQFLIKSATVIQEGHPRHLKRSDILISNGRIEKIGANISSDAEVIKGKDLMVTAGWHDMRVHLTDPGNEHKETLDQLCDTAAAGGFTSLSTLPDSLPVVDHKSGLQYILNSSKSKLVDIKPYGAVSEQLEGKHLAELFDMHQNGAVAFTDADRSLNGGLLKKALLYVQSFGGLVISTPLDNSLHHDGQVNESENTVTTGLRTSPAIAEYSCVKQQLDILEYCGGKMHFSGISSKESVALIKEAKKNGLNISCDVSIYNLCYTDEQVTNFDSNFKLLPMLRSEKDKNALIKGVNDGTIDVIVSNHKAQNVELKKVEFDYADEGTIVLQQLYPLYNQWLKDKIDHATFIKALTSNPRNLLLLDKVELKEGESANLAVFDQEAEWTLNNASNKTQSNNTHLWNSSLKGKAVAIFNGSKNQIN